jgi:arylsulfatase A-like enzyme
VLDYLRQYERLDNTIVVVTSDHGEGLGDHDWWTHGILYQEQIHAPLIIRGPSAPAGRRIDLLVRSIDIMPTVLDLAGVAAMLRPEMDGVSLVPLLAENAPPTEHTGYADSINMLIYRAPVGEDRKDDMLFVIRDGKWKYIHHSLGWRKCELYDLDSDPGELTNLYKAKPRVWSPMLKDLKSRDCFPKKQPYSQIMDKAERRRLEQLGYITTQPSSGQASQPATKPATEDDG